MAGNILYDERAIITLQDRTNTTAMTTGSGAAAATADLDVRAGGNAAGDFLVIFDLFCRWGTTTNIAKNVVVAELFLLPSLDGTTFPDVDLTAGSSFISPPHTAGLFIAAKQPGNNTDALFATGIVPLLPILYRAYIINRSSQTMTVTSGTSWRLRMISAQEQYT